MSAFAFQHHIRLGDKEVDGTGDLVDGEGPPLTLVLKIYGQLVASVNAMVGRVVEDAADDNDLHGQERRAFRMKCGAIFAKAATRRFTRMMDAAQREECGEDDDLTSAQDE